MKAVGEDTGKNMISILGKSTEELKAQAAGFAITTKEMAEAKLAHESITKAQATLGKAADQLILALAPVGEFLADRIPGAVEACKAAIQGFAPPVLGVMKNVVVGVGYLADAWAAAKSVVQIAVAGWIGIFGILLEKLGDLLALSDKLPESMQIPGIKETADDMRSFGKDTFNVGGEVFKEGLNGLQTWGDRARDYGVWFDGLMADREKRLDSQIKKLQPVKGVNPTTTSSTLGTTTAQAVQGSAEAAKIIQSWQFDAKTKDDIGRQQLAANKQANALLEAIRRAVGNTTRLGVI